MRARCKQHLERLSKRLEFMLVKSKILELKNRDYPFRIKIPKHSWIKCVTTLVIEQTYSNFKAECAVSMKDDKAYLDLLHDVWWQARQAYEKKDKMWEKEAAANLAMQRASKIRVDYVGGRPARRHVEELEIEHIDGNPKNQELANLRLRTRPR